MKRIILPFALSVVFLSCSRGNEDVDITEGLVIKPKETPILLTKMTNKIDNITTQTDYVYDGDRIVSTTSLAQTGDKLTNTFIYQGDFIVKQVFKIPTTTDYFTYNYSPNGKLIFSTSVEKTII